MDALKGGNYKVQLQKVRYSHDAMIDMIIANPTIKQTELAEAFGYSKQWISMVLCSDAFQARLAARKDDVVTSELTQTFKTRISALATQSAELFLKKLNDPADQLTIADRDLLSAIKMGAAAHGLAGQSVINNTNNNQVNNYVALIPQKSESAESWAKEFGAEIGKGEEVLKQPAVTPPPPPGILALVTTEAMDTTPPMTPIGKTAKD